MAENANEPSTEAGCVGFVDDFITSFLFQSQIGVKLLGSPHEQWGNLNGNEKLASIGRVKESEIY